MFYIGLIVSLFLMYQIYVYSELKKHDKYLFKFCQIRRDAMKLLRDGYEDLSKEDYVALSGLLKVLNTSIRHYNMYKTILFNFRFYLAFFKAMKASNRKIESMPTCNNPKVNELYSRTRYAILEAFFAYTPFLKSEIVLNISYGLLKAFARSGMESVGKFLMALSEVRALKHDVDHFRERHC